MIGATKQVAWATKIRAARIAEVEALLAEPATDEAKLANRNRVMAALRSDILPAKLYIETRGNTTSEFGWWALRELDAAGRKASHGPSSDLRMCELAALKDRILDR